MKSVLISIRPAWCGKIAEGKKTVEVRKTCPKLQTPFRCYIYCTKDYKMQFWMGRVYSYADDHSHNAFDRCGNGKIIGEFVCDKIIEIRKRGVSENFDYCYLPLNVFGNDDIEPEIRAIAGSCIPKHKLNEYGEKAASLYAWNISNLLIYETPKSLHDLHAPCTPACNFSEECGGTNAESCLFPVARAPQNWMYVEELI